MLVAHGVNCFVDEKSLDVGNPADQKMDRAVENAKIVLIAPNSAFIESEYCLRELKKAMDRSGKGCLCFPVFISSIDTLKHRLIQLPHSEDIKKACKEFLRTTGWRVSDQKIQCHEVAAALILRHHDKIEKIQDIEALRQKPEFIELCNELFPYNGNNMVDTPKELQKDHPYPKISRHRLIELLYLLEEKVTDDILEIIRCNNKPIVASKRVRIKEPRDPERLETFLVEMGYDADYASEPEKVFLRIDSCFEELHTNKIELRVSDGCATTECLSKLFEPSGYRFLRREELPRIVKELYYYK